MAEARRALKPVRPSRAVQALKIRGDHAAFHKTVLRAAGGGALGALVAKAIVILGVPETATLTAATLFAAGVAGGALAAVASEGRRWWRGLAGAVLGAGAASTAFVWPWPALTALALGTVSVPFIAPRASRGRQLFSGLMAGLFGAAGLFVGVVLMGWDPLSSLLPGLLASGVAGAAGGLFFGLASAPKHLAPPQDPVAAAFASALSVRDGEIHEILKRAQAIYGALQTELGQRHGDPSVAPMSQRSGQAVMRVLDIARQCRQVDADLAATPALELDDRIAELHRKVEAARDPSAQQTYRDAIASLEAQKEAVERISLGRERIVARLHANVAILEKLRFSLIHLRNAQAERVGDEASPAVEALDELGRELDATASAVGEVFGSRLSKP